VWAGGLLLPGTWYAVVLWHVGFFAHRGALRQFRLHRAAFLALVVIVAATAIAILLDPTVRGNPLVLLYAFPPSLILAGPVIEGVPFIGRLPWIALVYAGLLIACTALAVDALRHPAPSRRMMGDQARERARPWLAGASLVWLATSLVVCGGLLIYMPRLLQMRAVGLASGTSHTALQLDLAVSLLVLLGVGLIGQAVVSYEIFTGRSLPRRGLRQSWHGALLLAPIVSVFLTWTLTPGFPPIAGALLTMLLVTALYAGYTAQSVRARERAMAELRAASGGPGLYRTLLTGDTGDDATAFGALCARVLGVHTAALVPLGPLATLLPPVAYPPDAPLPADVRDLADGADPAMLCHPADPARHAGALWAVPLWGDRGLHGLLLLGPKADGSLYAEEEMEAARAAGERLLDARAGAELARRLVQVQRAQLAESQVADRRTRRVLHDDVLPQVHAAMLAASAGTADTPALLAQLGDLHKQIANLLHVLPTATVQTLAEKGVLGALRLCVEGELAEAFTHVEWAIDPAAEAALAALPPLTAEVLYGAAREAARNAARYARGGDETRPLTLRINAELAGELRLTLADDGVGLGSMPSTGAGRGMALHGTLLAILGGAWTAESGGGTRVTLSVPADA
jgi:signal transduction histidine kinase